MRLVSTTAWPGGMSMRNCARDSEPACIIQVARERLLSIAQLACAAGMRYSLPQNARSSCALRTQHTPTHLPNSQDAHGVRPLGRELKVDAQARCGVDLALDSLRVVVWDNDGVQAGCAVCGVNERVHAACRRHITGGEQGDSHGWTAWRTVKTHSGSLSPATHSCLQRFGCRQVAARRHKECMLHSRHKGSGKHNRSIGRHASVRHLPLPNGSPALSGKL